MMTSTENQRLPAPLSVAPEFGIKIRKIGDCPDVNRNKTMNFRPMFNLMIVGLFVFGCLTMSALASAERRSTDVSSTSILIDYNLFHCRCSTFNLGSRALVV
jgi:hypothetical protein